VRATRTQRSVWFALAEFLDWEGGREAAHWIVPSEKFQWWRSQATMFVQDRAAGSSAIEELWSSLPAICSRDLCRCVPQQYPSSARARQRARRGPLPVQSWGMQVQQAATPRRRRTLPTAASASAIQWFWFLVRSQDEACARSEINQGMSPGDEYVRHIGVILRKSRPCCT
jgi:hypothetical protein